MISKIKSFNLSSRRPEGTILSNINCAQRMSTYSVDSEKLSQEPQIYANFREMINSHILNFFAGSSMVEICTRTVHLHPKNLSGTMMLHIRVVSREKVVFFLPDNPVFYSLFFTPPSTAIRGPT